MKKPKYGWYEDKPNRRIVVERTEHGVTRTIPVSDRLRIISNWEDGVLYGLCLDELRRQHRVAYLQPIVVSHESP